MEMKLVDQEMGNTLSWTGKQSLVIFSVAIILSLRSQSTFSQKLMTTKLMFASQSLPTKPK